MIACREIRLRLVPRNLSYVVYKRSDGKWGVPIFSMFIDVPDQAEQKLGDGRKAFGSAHPLKSVAEHESIIGYSDS